MSFLLRCNMNYLYTLPITIEQEGNRVKDILSDDIGLSRRDISRLHHEKAIFLNEETCPLSYIVKKGDTLFSIAKIIPVSILMSIPDMANK